MVLKLLDKFQLAGTIGGSIGSNVNAVEISMSVSEFFCVGMMCTQFAKPWSDRFYNKTIRNSAFGRYSDVARKE
jgi:hypothetical protein